jgi:alpha-N-acetylglucosaminidase
MYGVMEALASEPAAAMAAQGSSMLGVGMAPEGIEQNPIVYDLMAEWAFRCGVA